MRLTAGLRGGEVVESTGRRHEFELRRRGSEEERTPWRSSEVAVVLEEEL